MADSPAEHALAPTPELLRELWAKAPVARAVLDRAGTVRYVNDALCDLLGVAAEDLAARPLAVHLTAGDRASVQSLVLAASENAAPGVMHATSAANRAALSLALTKAGSDGLVFLTAHRAGAPVPDPVRVADQRLLAVIEAAGAVIYMKDTEGRLLLANQRCAELAGRPREELLGLTDFEIFPADLAETYRAHDREVMAGGQPIEFDEESVDADGNRRSYLSVKFPLLDDQGRAYALGGISTDVTDARAAADALADRERSYRTIVETAREGIWVIGPDGRTTFANRRLGEILGGTVEEIIGRHFTDFVRGADVEAAERALQRRRDGRADRSENEIHRLDGGRVWVRTASSPMHDDDGAFIGALAMVTDISDRRAAEEEIRRLNRDLEQLVAERTVELEEVNRDLRDFTSTVSHDLRSPLRAIEAFAEVLREDAGPALDASHRALIDRIGRSVRQMDAMITSLLEFARLGRRPVSRIRVDAGRIARRAVAEQLGGREELAAAVELGHLPVCRADPELLERVFANLVGNALKFTVDSPEPRITVGARRLEDGSVAYTVADNGIGLDPDQTERMFEPFNRLHADPRYGGTGIGLATVKRIVERHGGRVWAEGAPGAGATFCFTVGE